MLSAYKFHFENKNQIYFLSFFITNKNEAQYHLTL